MQRRNLRVTGSVDKCKNCGGELKYNPSTQNLICLSCDSERVLDKSHEIPRHDTNKPVNDSGYKSWIQQNKFLKCDSCGARVILDKYEITQICPYCGSNIMSKFHDLPGLKPDAIIPFEFDEKSASQRFARSVKNKFFVPRGFKKNIPPSKIHGIYIPAFAFDADSNSLYNATIVDNKTITVNGESRQITDKQYVSGSIICNHRNILVESSSKMSDYDLDSILPYNFTSAYKFNQGFIKGYSVEHYQEVLNHCKNIAQNKFRNDIRLNISRLYDNNEVEDLELKTTYSNEKFSYYLLPIYNFECTYKNKKYMAKMNGQTGKVGRGLPVSGAKIASMVGLGLLGLAAFGLLIYYIITM